MGKGILRACIYRPEAGDVGGVIEAAQRANERLVGGAAPFEFLP